MQWQAHRFRGILFDNKKKIPWPKQEMCTPAHLFFTLPLPLLIQGQRVVASTKDQSLGFIFNDYSLFVNSLLPDFMRQWCLYL